MALTERGAPVELIGGVWLVLTTGQIVLDLGDGRGLVVETGELVFGITVAPPEPPARAHGRLGRHRPLRPARPQPQEQFVALQLFDAHRDGEYVLVLAMGASVQWRVRVGVAGALDAGLSMGPSVRVRRVEALRATVPTTLHMGGDLFAIDEEPLLLLAGVEFDALEVEA